ncbi:MAG: hypothetical protein Q8M26_08040 [Pseudolabrys sp.]|nr:hypothetical protein [Pseudolabrys sp.]
MAIFSIRLDETGTDGYSPITVVAGAVASPSQWDMLESKWSALLARSGVAAFHAMDFNDREPPFDNWSALKLRRFTDAQNKIIAKNTLFRVSVGIEQAAHQAIKERMRGIKGFMPESDYSLCLRYMLFHASEQLSKKDQDHELTVMVEDGPWSCGANATYQRIKGPSKWKASKHAHRLAGFATVPKGTRPSLEASDLIADQEIVRLSKGVKRSKRDTLSVLLTRERLDAWQEWMMEEKEIRRAWRAAQKTTSSFSEGGSE